MSAILIISPEPWDHLFVSKHHYAIELARRGHSVLFYGPPSDAGDLSIEIVERQGVSIGVVHSSKVAPGLRHMPAGLRNLLEARWLASLERQAKLPIDVIWLFENSRFYDMRFAGERLKIYQQVDLTENFNPKQAAGTCDLAVAISSPITNVLSQAAKQLIRVNHGYSPNEEKPLSSHVLDRYFSGPGPHAVLTGNLDIRYLDIQLLLDTVGAYPDVQFHFVGHYTPEAGLHAAVAEKNNVVFWGRQLSEALPSVFQRADILLLAYLADQYLEQLANPHKIMEYLASGKAILATRTLEYDGMPELVCIAHDREEYLKKFGEIIHDLPSWSAADRVAQRRAFAADNTYAHQVDRIAAALGERGYLLK